VHTVSESDRIRFTKILMDLREDETRDKMELSSDLTNTERKYVHLLASQLGMVSKSSGKGESRKITVSKRNDTKTKTSRQDEQLPILNIGEAGIAALRKHMRQFPPTDMEEMESKETGASLMEAIRTQQADTVLAARLNELDAGAPKEAPTAKVRTTKHVDLQRRRQRHEYFQTFKRGHDYARILQNRARLPVYARRDEIVETVRQTPVTIIQGETGSGKSTQCPQFLLDAHPDVNIAVTQRESA
jgi:HrpA-like RNA helicase